ncbi:DUF3343 domain-containing protein [Anaerostipes sp.]|uniref:DUF3343 domain-containing protein n=1 Tax=Anaerostipes sp. TaxID=1872530 RepID=UPI0025830C91|nr:DUF3343 domain-containing protein [Anaerostipes sp.]MCI5623986.1 DUF3343 domain-containing protein [Anaerostipes sp.]MDY2725417.1 DUF3343 domain-containing protein [Anaerostipes faecalis]
MRKKTKKLVVTFETTTGAIKMETLCKEHNISGRLISVPKQITAGCGMAWCTEPEKEKNLKEFMLKQKIIWEGIYTVLI